MAGLRDNYSDARLAVSHEPQEIAANGSVPGNTIDTQGNDSHLFVACIDEIPVGVTVTMTILESDASNMAGAVIAGSRDILVGLDSINDDGGPNSVEMTAGEDVIAKIGYVGNRRYLQLVLGTAGIDDNEYNVSVVYVGNHNHQQPVA